MSSRHASHGYAVVTLMPMAWLLFGGCGGSTVASEAESRPACVTEVISRGVPNCGCGGSEAGSDHETPGFVRVTNAAECQLSARLPSSDHSDGSDADPRTIECKALCCATGAVSCAGTLVSCSILQGDEVKCDAFGY